jgi:phage host-nuclease inhibitor protein Gam
MAETVTKDLILEQVRAIQAVQAQQTRLHREIRDHLGALERQYASISRRVDSIDDRIDHINRRLDLSDTPAAGE